MVDSVNQQLTSEEISEDVLARREKYLKVLGVTQYRRRSLTVVTASSKGREVNQALDKTTQSSSQNPNTSDEPKSNNEPVLDKQKRSALFDTSFNKTPPSSSAVNRVDIAQEHVIEKDTKRGIESGIKNDVRSGVEKSENKATPAVEVVSQAAPYFDLLIWRTKGLLVLDFSRSETELTAIKHRLTNNILRAIWPSGFSGCDMYQYSWPITGIRPDAESGREWFNSLVSGYIQQGENTPIWLMGEAGLDLLFHEQKQEDRSPEKSLYDDLIGTRTRHPKMDIDFLVGPSLSKLLESSVAKVQTWQLLKALRNSDSSSSSAN